MADTKEELKIIADKFQDIKTKMDTRFYVELWKEMGLKLVLSWQGILQNNQ